MLHPSARPCLGFAAWSGTGKTTLLLELIPRLTAAGLRLGLAKHSHHALDLDHAGKDSQRLRTAGADQVVVAAPRRLARIEARSRELDECLTLLARAPAPPDLILVEGWKHASIPRLELHRPALGLPLLAPADPNILAVACDAPPEKPAGVPLLPLGDADAIAACVLGWLAAGRLG